jgi:peroxiredoxin
MKYRLLIFSVLLLAISCNNTNKNSEGNKDISGTPASWVPAQDPVTYWDGFYFGDTARVKSKQMMIWMNDYLRLLQGNPEKVSTSFTHSLGIASKDSLGYASLTTMFKKYLYDPNSPYRNDEWYISVLEHMKSSDKAGAGEPERAKLELEMLYKNRVGEKATDFTYTLPSGKTDELYDLSAENILIFFYNPGCESCKEVIERMNSSSILTKAISVNLIKILAIYPDEDISLWKSHTKEIPSKWINSYDKYQAILNKKLYDLKAIPTLYLLDKDKKVKLKDADFMVIEKYLIENYPLILQ